MSLSPQCRLILKALMISVALNCVLLVMSVFGGSPEGGSLVARIADAIAAPPGAIAQRVFAPKKHSVGAFVAAATESLAWSIIFYAIVALLILEGFNFLRKRRGANG
jgi:hypothetical protein